MTSVISKRHARDQRMVSPLEQLLHFKNIFLTKAVKKKKIERKNAFLKSCRISLHKY